MGELGSKVSEGGSGRGPALTGVGAPYHTPKGGRFDYLTRHMATKQFDPIWEAADQCLLLISMFPVSLSYSHQNQLKTYFWVRVKINKRANPLGCAVHSIDMGLFCTSALFAYTC